MLKIFGSPFRLPTEIKLLCKLSKKDKLNLSQSFSTGIFEDLFRNFYYIDIRRFSTVVTKFIHSLSSVQPINTEIRYNPK